VPPDEALAPEECCLSQEGTQLGAGLQDQGCGDHPLLHGTPLGATGPCAEDVGSCVVTSAEEASGEPCLSDGHNVVRSDAALVHSSDGEFTALLVV